MPIYLTNTLGRSFCTYYKLPWQWNAHMHWHGWEYDASASDLSKHVREGSICIAVVPKGEGGGLWCGSRWGWHCLLNPTTSAVTRPLWAMQRCWSLLPQFPHSWKAYFNSLERHKNWLNRVCKTAKKEALCKCHGGLLLFNLLKEHQTVFCIWAQPDLRTETENCILKIQELLFNSLGKHSQPVFALCPELHLPYSQFFGNLVENTLLCISIIINS